MVVETVAVVAMIVGIASITAATVGAITIFGAPINSPVQDKNEIHDKDFQARLNEMNSDQIYVYSNFGVYPRFFSGDHGYA